MSFKFKRAKKTQNETSSESNNRSHNKSELHFIFVLNMYTVYTTSIFSYWKKKHKSNLRLIVVLALYSTSLQKNLTPFFVALDQYVLCSMYVPLYYCTCVKKNLTSIFFVALDQYMYNTLYMSKEKSNLHFYCCPRPVHVHCTCLKKNLTSIFIVARVKRPKTNEPP